VLLDPSAIDRIVKMRERTISLPVKRGAFNELKRCPVAKGRRIKLEARTPYERLRAQADDLSPTRAQAVISLIDQCLLPKRSLEITITSVERQADEWRIRFERGDQRQEPRLLSAKPGADYTSSPSRALNGSGEEVSTSIQAKYAEHAAEHRADMRSEAFQSASQAIGALARGLPKGKPSKRLDSLQYTLRALESEVA
jgi:hypothetical protein